jgi:hypothetical protein
MTDFAFEFTRVDSFLDDMNREGCFDVLDMDGITPNYRMVLASDCPDDINECLDEDGTLNENVSLVEDLDTEDGECALLWSRGINGERTISMASSTVKYDLKDKNSELKAVFLVNTVEGSGYVLAYAINSYSFPIDGEVILPCDGMLWSIVYGG